jgi:hypothetical protein
MKQIVTLLTIVALITGCQTPTHERAFMTLGPTEAPATKAVRYSGQYRLYANPPRSPTTQNATPLVDTRLGKGELLGFALSDSGNLLAIIRGEQKPLANTGSYTWTMQPDPGQIDPDRTVGLIVAVLFVAGVGLGILAWANRPFQ